MKRYKVIFLPHAERRLAAIEAYIAERASQAIAERFVAVLVDRALKLDSFPSRGTPRNDLMQGLRTIVHRRTVTIAYVVDGDEIEVTDFLYRGEDVAGRFGS
ncbi:MAG TPA: type II toxin-antitoxin system RelE/ParE family toxin [Allosphingosinicella sp.]|nr:type II toxin-antitoxin system RelE/ParE family toxin [Allosphingosinicella sp.]